MGVRSATVGLLVASILMPAFALAQSDLSDTIRGALLSDPRTASFTPDQLDAMTEILAGAARERGLTVADITWRPQAEFASSQGAQVPPAMQCDSMPAFFCAMTDAFGLTGPDYIIAIWLGASSLLLMFIFAMVIERHRAHLKAHATPVQGA